MVVFHFNSNTFLNPRQWSANTFKNLFADWPRPLCSWGPRLIMPPKWMQIGGINLTHPPVQLSALLPSHSHRVDLWICLAPSAHTRLSGTLELITPPHSHLLRYKYTVDSSAWHKFAIIILRPVALFSGGVFLWPDSLFLSVSVFSQSPRRFNLLWLAATPAPVFGAARSSTIEF